ncbi:PLP-dependent aminotransferase family protein [Alcaligenaceae bacterium]|nr:PLP-dependent aminotransferase family protein [Alcaligenaceae bacterium]
MTKPRSHAMWILLFQRWEATGLSLQGQIRQMLVSAVLDSQVSVDVPLPSCRDMASILRVSRNTVVSAYQHLVDTGYLISRERKGFFVNPNILQGRVATPPSQQMPEVTPGSQTQWRSRFRYLPSGQRNIGKRADWQSYPYPFLYGQFDANLFPVAEWRECCLRTLGSMEVREWAQDMILRDDESLLQQIRTRLLPRRGVWAADDEIIITVGAQHALYMLSDLLIGQDTLIGIEDPGYPDARNIFSTRSNRILSLPIDEEGLMISPALGGCEYVYTTPSHQCPTTVTMSMARREVLLEQAERSDFILIEDDYESQTSFHGDPLPPLKSIDRSGRVIYIGSLSKTMAPGMRLGFVVAPRELIHELRMVRRLNIRHPNAFVQRAFALFLSLGYYDSLLRRLTTASHQRANTLLAALETHMPEVRYVPISGGSSCWVEGPAWLDVTRLAEDAATLGVLIEPGAIFFRDPGKPRNCFRLGYSSIDSTRIEEGIRLLSVAMNNQRPA